MNQQFDELATKLLTPHGLSLIHSPIIRVRDIQGALRRAAIILFTYQPTTIIDTDPAIDRPLGFKLPQWLETIATEITDFLTIEIIELLNLCTGISSSDLADRLQQLYSHYEFTPTEIAKSLPIPPFNISERTILSMHRTIANDFGFLSNDESWFKMTRQGNVKYFQRQPLSKLPIFADQSPTTFDLQTEISTNQKQILAEYIDLLAFLEPELSSIADQLSPSPSDQRRVHMHLDYVVPEDHELADQVEENHQFLRDLWFRKSIPPIFFRYDSISAGQELECIVYPVCIYYFQRAKYLCAWGHKSTQGMTWHNYRLDRMQSESLEEIAWDNEDLCSTLLQAYQNSTLPTPADIQAEMALAWGFDFYQKSATLLLRFDRTFHDQYIANTFRHQTFQPITSIPELEQLLATAIPDPQLLTNLQNRIHHYPQDAYYQAQVRLHDTNIIMRLRAWGDKVEVLAPTTIRQRMITDIQKTLTTYNN
jgi:CRISPR-associated protein (TIGR03985 family)